MTSWFVFEHIPEGQGARYYLGSTPSDADGKAVDRTAPQAFLVRWGPDKGTLPVHWHPVAQFQCFVGGTAKFGRHAVGPGSVHYSDAYTPYGPLVSDDRDAYFLTLRIGGDRGAFFMPDSQADLRERREQHPGPRRNTSYDLRDAPAGLVDAQEDGLQVEVVAIEPDEQISVGGGSVGGYAVVLEGAVDDDGIEVGPGGVRHLGDTCTIRSRAGGSRLGILRFPDPETMRIAAGAVTV
jgi:hypothetical protein